MIGPQKQAGHIFSSWGNSPSSLGLLSSVAINCSTTQRTLSNTSNLDQTRELDNVLSAQHYHQPPNSLH